MYISRRAEDIFKLATLAVANKFFENLITVTVKEIAEQFSASESQVHFWKNLLLREGPKIFLSLKPGRKKKDFSSYNETDKLLVYETINNLLKEGQEQGGKNRKFWPEVKKKIILERDRLKEGYSLKYEDFAGLIGIDSGILRLWARKLKQGGVEGLKDKSRAPKERPSKLADWLIKEIVIYGSWWKKRYRRIKLTDFGIHFRWKYQRVLKACGKSNLSNKAIARYLKESGLYKEKEERPEGKRGAFKYYFPGAQILGDTVTLRFWGIKAKVIGALDALSKDIFHQEAFLRENALNVIKSIKCSLDKAKRLGLRIISFTSDHGKPYKAKSVGEYLKDKGIFRIFAAPYWPQGKAAIERYFRTLKEALSNRRETLILFIRGIFIWIKKRVVIGCLNFILTGFNAKYENKKGIDGKSPRERLNKSVTQEYEKAAQEILKARGERTELKIELIRGICKEFGFRMEVKNYLGRYPESFLKEGQEALRRKLAIMDLEVENRWFYLTKVVKNLEEKKREEKLAQAKRTVYLEETKAKFIEERQKVEEERRWYENHPEEALNEAIEWQLALYGDRFAMRLYGGRIAERLKKVVMNHSSLTSDVRVNKICEKIQRKERLESDKIRKEGYSLPSEDKLNEAKENVIALIRRSYLQFKDEIPVFQGLRTFV